MFHCVLLFLFRTSHIEFPQIGLALLEVIDHGVTIHPFNASFLKTQGDTFYGKIKCYLGWILWWFKPERTPRLVHITTHLT